jgi:hypothetical protein
MKDQLRTLAAVLVSLFFVTAGAPCVNAQIMNAINAHIDHAFVIGNATLPPGDYTFRMMHGSDLQLMTVTSKNDKISVEFIVREAIDDHSPNHSVLLFRKYGNTEFLSKIFEVGSKTGVAVAETSRKEDGLMKQGQQGAEHAEEQK